ncbi:MAG TPA: hypothetical protein VMP67_10680 [Candidatus Limnocylindria bacterium]|nr:hypothetical protein [Candidatus Limnocylindria bacterium]
MADLFPELTNIYCVVCGRALGQLPEDQPDAPNGPLCGECYQTQQFEDELWAAEMEE